MGPSRFGYRAGAFQSYLHAEALRKEESSLMEEYGTDMQRDVETSYWVGVGPEGMRERGRWGWEAGRERPFTPRFLKIFHLSFWTFPSLFNINPISEGSVPTIHWVLSLNISYIGVCLHPPGHGTPKGRDSVLFIHQPQILAHAGCSKMVEIES